MPIPISNAKKYIGYRKYLNKPIDSNTIDSLLIQSEYIPEMNLYMKNHRITDISGINSIVSANRLNRQVFFRKIPIKPLPSIRPTVETPTP